METRGRILEVGERVRVGISEGENNRKHRRKAGERKCVHLFFNSYTLYDNNETFKQWISSLLLHSLPSSPSSIFPPKTTTIRTQTHPVLIIHCSLTFVFCIKISLAQNSLKSDLTLRLSGYPSHESVRRGCLREGHAETLFSTKKDSILLLSPTCLPLISG